MIFSTPFLGKGASRRAAFVGAREVILAPNPSNKTVDLAPYWPTGTQVGDHYIICGTWAPGTALEPVPTPLVNYQWPTDKQSFVWGGQITSDSLSSFVRALIRGTTDFLILVYRGANSVAYINKYGHGGMTRDLTASYSKSENCIGIVAFYLENTPDNGALPASPAFAERLDTGSSYGNYRGVAGDLLTPEDYTGPTLTFDDPNNNYLWRTVFILELRR